jgi:hypothetical protein
MKVFTEEQKFNQSLIYIGLTISLLAVILSLLNEWKKNINTSFNDTIPVLFAIIIIGLVILLFLLLKLQTKIDENGINYKFYPLQSSYKNIPWNSISEYYIRNYNPISEFGGWGIKSSFRKKTGKAYTIKGTIGLQLTLKNGKKILIGTQKKEEIERVLETYKHKISPNEI